MRHNLQMFFSFWLNDYIKKFVGPTVTSESNALVWYHRCLTISMKYVNYAMNIVCSHIFVSENNLSLRIYIFDLFFLNICYHIVSISLHDSIP